MHIGEYLLEANDIFKIVETEIDFVILLKHIKSVWRRNWKKLNFQTCEHQNNKWVKWTCLWTNYTLFSFHETIVSKFKYWTQSSFPLIKAKSNWTNWANLNDVINSVVSLIFS